MSRRLSIETWPASLISLLAFLTFFTSVHHSAASVVPEIRASGQDAILSWTNQPGATYVVEYKTNLNTGPWQLLTTNLPAGPGDLNTLVLSNILSQWPAQFFRVSTGAPIFNFTWSGTNFTYTDSQRSFTGILLKPAGNGPFPAVVIHHGAGGTATGYSLPKALEMTSWGMVSIAPTLTHAAGGETNPVNMGFCPENLARTTACLDLLRAFSFVDTNRLALFGHSMGAFATIGNAAALVGRVRAAGITSGGIIPDSAGTSNAAPTVTEANPVRAPFVMFHCDADPVVPLLRSQLLQQVLNSNAVTNLRVVIFSNAIANPSNWHNIHQDPIINAEIMTRTFQWFRMQGVLP